MENENGSAKFCSFIGCSRSADAVGGRYLWISAPVDLRRIGVGWGIGLYGCCAEFQKLERDDPDMSKISRTMGADRRKMKEIVVYIHGKGGSAEEGWHYKPLFSNCEVIGFDYHAQTPWEAGKEFPIFFAQQRQHCDRLTLIAGSIGAFFAMSALDETLVDRAYFVSPVVDMENLIGNMMQWADVTEDKLEKEQEIPTNFGETLSWRYLCYVREHPILWNVPTKILYGERDSLTSMETISAFARRHHAKLTVMPDGEHWFHTAEQMQFLDDWLKKETLAAEGCQKVQIGE